MEPFVDAAFPALGKSVPIDHGYVLFAALSHVIAALHAESGWAVHPIRGVRLDRDELALDRGSFVKLRVPASAIGHLLPLAGAKLEIEGRAITLGVPRLFPLVPAAALKARLVTVKGHSDTEATLHDSIRRKLAHLQLEQDPERVEVRIGARRVMRIGPVRRHERKAGEVADRDIVVGYSVELHGLEAAGSLEVQRVGIGGRRHMGAGVFVPFGRNA